MDAREVIVRPVVSERSYEMIEHNRYTFEVDKRARKPEIASAVAEVFRSAKVAQCGDQLARCHML